MTGPVTMQVARSIRIRSRCLRCQRGRRVDSSAAARSDQRQRQVVCRYKLAARAQDARNSLFSDAHSPRRTPAIICPRTSQFNGGTSHPKLKTWDSRPTQPETSRTAAGTRWASLPSSYGIYCFTSAFELWDLSLQQDLQTKDISVTWPVSALRCRQRRGRRSLRG